jgi:hypothetical protein
MATPGEKYSMTATQVSLRLFFITDVHESYQLIGYIVGGELKDIVRTDH